MSFEGSSVSSQSNPFAFPDFLISSKASSWASIVRKARAAGLAYRDGNSTPMKDQRTLYITFEGLTYYQEYRSSREAYSNVFSFGAAVHNSSSPRGQTCRYQRLLACSHVAYSLHESRCQSVEQAALQRCRYSKSEQSSTLVK